MWTRPFMNVHVYLYVCICKRGNLTYTDAAFKRRKCRPKRDISFFKIWAWENEDKSAAESNPIKGKDLLCAARLRSDYMRNEQGVEITFSLWFRLIYVFENCSISMRDCLKHADKNSFPIWISFFFTISNKNY